MPELTVEQTRVLDELRRAKELKASARARIEAENRKRLEDGLREAEVVMNRLVRQAFEAGVSKRQIGRQGLGTSDPTIVNRLLSKTEGEARIAERLAALAGPPPIRTLTEAQVAERGLEVDPHADAYVELHYPHFPTAWRGAVEQYPDPLRGVVKRVFGLWSVLEDPSEVFLAWELDELEPNGGVLLKLLDGFVAQVAA